MFDLIATQQMAFLASIPSPSQSSVELGPFTLRAYGVALAVGVLVALWITQRRWLSIGGGSEIVSRMAFWVIPAGVVGARIYHVITDFELYRDNLSDIPKIWEGGLGIWGGVAAGALAMWWVLKSSGASTTAMMWAAAPALPIGQAIGRLGNWFNQELFGRPTDLPWALEIDIDNRPQEYLAAETFHPAFLYEALWNLALAAALIWVAPRLMRWLRPHNGALIGAYMVGYTAGRVWIELLRIDEANKIAGLRINVWTSIVVGLAGIVILFVAYRRQQGEDMSTDGDTGMGGDTAGDMGMADDASMAGDMGESKSEDTGMDGDTAGDMGMADDASMAEGMAGGADMADPVTSIKPNGSGEPSGPSEPSGSDEPNDSGEPSASSPST